MRPLGRIVEIETGLLAADQLDIDLGENLGIEKRAVLRAARIVDAIARAERVEIVRRARMLAPRQRQGVDAIVQDDGRPPEARIFGVEEADVEGRVVNDQAGIADEGREFLRHRGENRLVGQKFVAQPVHPEGALRDGKFGVDIDVVELARSARG